MLLCLVRITQCRSNLPIPVVVTAESRIVTEFVDSRGCAVVSTGCIAVRDDGYFLVQFKLAIGTLDVDGWLN